MAYRPRVIHPARCLRTVAGSRSSGWPLSLILRLMVVMSARFRVPVGRLAGVRLSVDEQAHESRTFSRVTGTMGGLGPRWGADSP